MTMAANTAESAKIGEPVPESLPIAVVRAVTNAECALGMPPMLTR